MCAAHKGVKDLPILAQGLPAVSLESLILNHQLIVSACPPMAGLPLNSYPSDFFFLFLFLSSSLSNIFLKRTDFGVTSTYSSSPIYSIASSNENFIAGAIDAFSSAPEARILDSFFCLGHIYYQIIIPCTLSYHLSCIYFFIWLNEKFTPVLQFIN